MVISKIFDSRHVPENIIKYLLYHEMLHIAVPVQFESGRRKIHSPEFKRKERLFPEYVQIQNWIKNNLKKLK